MPRLFSPGIHAGEEGEFYSGFGAGFDQGWGSAWGDHDLAGHSSGLKWFVSHQEAFCVSRYFLVCSALQLNSNPVAKST